MFRKIGFETYIMAHSLQCITASLAKTKGTTALLGLARIGYAPSRLSSTDTHKKLMEFFEIPDNWGERRVRSGRSWKMDELRLKSNSDLHKLWFVLYKERNMLLTMKEDADVEKETFPNPERIDKVEESMANLENVVRERNKAYWQLEVSPEATGERRTVFRRDVFGRYRWHKCSQHLVPYRSNKIFRETQGPGKRQEVDWFVQRYREQQTSRYNGSRSRTARHIRHLLRRFPNTDIEYLKEIYPEFPEGYIEHLKDNLDLYDDPPTRTLRHKQLKSAVKALA